MALTYQQILQLAPDAISIEKAKSLQKSNNWLLRAENDSLLWGECKSSGQQVYAIAADKASLQTSCSCPSTKFPCKHALALLLSFVDERKKFNFHDLPPEWVPNQLAQPTTASSKTENTSGKLDHTSLDKRILLMQAGVAELEIWLLDLIRQGLASLEKEPPEFWNSFAARMVDAKLGSIARKIRSFKVLFSEAEWLPRITEEIAYLHLFCQGFKRLSQQNAAIKEDLLAAAGVNQKKEELLYQKGIQDRWLVLGQREGEEENLRWRRTWLLGVESGRFALLLDFAWGFQDYSLSWPIASAYSGEIVFYPGAYPLRAIFKRFQFYNEPIDSLKGFVQLEELASAFARALAKNPLLYSIPALLAKVYVMFELNHFFLLDQNNKQIPLSISEEVAWKLIALSGGQAIGLFGEWNGRTFSPLSVFSGSRIVKI